MKLSEPEVSKELSTLQGWTRKGEGIQRVFKLPTFADAIAFVTRLAFDAEANDHHPDLQISFRTVTVTWSTHSEGGVTAKDIKGAKQTEALAKRY
jgi:4a-hydroxytetrahydrobiopterin dehydratase